MKQFYFIYLTAVLTQSVLFYLIMNINQYSYEIEINTNNIIWQMPLSFIYGFIMTYLFSKDMLRRDNI